MQALIQYFWHAWIIWQGHLYCDPTCIELDMLRLYDKVTCIVTQLVMNLTCLNDLNVFLGRTRPFLSVKIVKWAPFLSKGTTSQHWARLYGPSLMNTRVAKVYHDITYLLLWLACFEDMFRVLGCVASASTNRGACWVGAWNWCNHFVEH